MRKLIDYVLLFFKGIAMGGADVVPGVSGGTVAFITGIYQELLDSIKSIDKQALQLLFKGRFKDLWLHVNGSFLLVLLSGIFVSILSLAKLILFFMAHYPVQLWSFFFGLIIISSLLVIREVKKWSVGAVISLIVGVVVAYFICISTPTQTTEAFWFIFLSGAIAICAMILPGISGSFILLILGKYEFIISALRDFNVPVIIVFALGCVVGLLSFSRVVSYLLHHFQALTVASLSGFMIGSLVKIWPWKVVTIFRLNSKGEQVPAFDRNVWPAEYMEVTQKSPYILQAVAFMALGILLVVLIEKMGNRLKRTDF